MNLHLPAGSTAHDAWALEIPAGRPEWTHTSLRILDLPPGGSHRWDSGEEEAIVLPLAGSGTVGCDGESFELTGRQSVFDRVSDLAYVPRDSAVSVYSIRGGRFAVAGARCERRLAPAYLPAESVPVEVRGAGSATRQVNNFGVPGVLEADRLIACEVLTPGGNWSSFPPHKHDCKRPGLESELEEIYYFELSRPGLAYHRVYGTAERPIDVLAEVRDGDVVLVPHGWHGPSIAAPGVDLYYLNVMAGPGPERAWLICDDPAHAWVRGTWLSQECDPRVPMTSAAGRITH
ncbi:5-deoxy-glucuronate isomerase [Sporichthya brevicatena]|uniref:5-deoxy-glucuronate isomerase n=1 Tax=Sporichthya brevicatena TaxID=171442 RepID=A0ABN1HC63_9ACTN